ncbi:MAG: ABC transporter permease [Eubacteriales bacterium]|nr:ABC transporter permease [Eubacteriales bacterium]
MLGYSIKRILLAMLTTFIVIVITFFTMHAVPGGPFSKEKAPSPAVQAVLEARFGLDKPVEEQFVQYLQNMFKGDWGISLKNGREIRDTVAEGIGISARLGLSSALVALVVGSILGVTAAVFRNKLPDRFIIFFTTLLVSVPSFVLATILLYFFSQKLGWFPVWSATQPSYVLPVLSLAMYPMAYITRMTKSSMLDVLGEDYIRTARAKGVRRSSVLFKHALRNAILPIITYLGPMLAYTITGSMVVETVFTMGGLGRIFVNSITNRDYPIIMACTIILSILMVIMTLLCDLIYKLVDPRIDFD